MKNQTRRHLAGASVRYHRLRPTLDAAKLDLLFDLLLEKKGMGGLTVVRDGKVIYSRSFGYRQISRHAEAAAGRGYEVPDRVDHQDVG